MNHDSSQDIALPIHPPTKGFWMAMHTVFHWSWLPAVLQLCLQHFDVFTVTFFRFLLSFVLLGVYILVRHQPIVDSQIADPQKQALTPKAKWITFFILIGCSFGLAGNYYFYIESLKYISPSSSAFIMQTSPIILALLSWWFLKERLNLFYWLGFALMIAGILIFFMDQVVHVTASSKATKLGYLICLCSSVSWAFYAILQKKVLSYISPNIALLCLYFICAWMFLPFASLPLVTSASWVALALLILAGINTILAYSSFSVALNLWSAAQVGMVLGLTPLLTVFMMKFLHLIWPQYIAAETFTTVKAIGGGFIIGAVIFSSYSRKPKKIP